MLYSAIDKNKINAATGDFHSFFINGNKSFKYITLYKSDKKIAQAIDKNKKLIYFIVTKQSFYVKFYNVLIIHQKGDKFEDFEGYFNYCFVFILI